MGEYEGMQHLLEATGLYAAGDDSIVGAELQAYAAGLDPLFDAIQELKRECFVSTAQDYGLSCREAMLNRVNLLETLQGRRNALEKALSLTAKDCTVSGMQKVIESFNAHGTLTFSDSEMKIVFHCTDSMNEEQRELMQEQMRLMMPCWTDFELTVESQ